MNNYPHPLGPARRRGPFRAGERVQLTDVKGKKYTVTLMHGGYFQSQRGSFKHDDLIGKDEGTVFDADGHQLMALRPLMSDYVLSMPRGAAVIYPKDSAQIVAMADIFPGAKVVEAGVGSGALTLSLLAAIGPEGHLTSVERREEFAEIAIANVESWYGPQMPAWDVLIGSVSDHLEETTGVDAVLLDMLAPWENIEPAAHALRPGGVILAYVATTTQMSRFVETLRESQCFTEPEASETLQRTWHLNGLAVRPDHRMVAHTGFLIVARRIAPGSQPLEKKMRPAPGAHNEAPEWSAEDFEERTISEKKLRKVRRDVARRADIEASGTAEAGPAQAAMDEKITAEGAAKAEANLHAIRARRVARKAQRDE
ncbi:tRNA (adenine57-N1/adenine58-N1)-methyltransferase [Arcanobacterium wilhelmae]|uniref:tRNA (Adenine57-N1/adenine58-N1)-methyltransferase n=1 Tax=Arcanobacterium wilhelmae TaxID=1803177 RepID=A0ABT9N8E0_9ACTO|nr:tRNA (adenine-N1)-methyltransferase [Arcanobacterium wilhelmae]MDP9799970.1 tRNA (adenine57-N1/adenine58-N1)-methyltransferase [Arcanobacterium wilhelmae]